MGRRSSSTSAPALAALAVLLLLVVTCSFHCGAAAARPLLPVHHENGLSVKGAAADGLVLPEGGAAGNGDELISSAAEVKVGEEAEDEAAATACEEGDADECAQRRLLSNAHLDYIYTQHKGNKP